MRAVFDSASIFTITQQNHFTDNIFPCAAILICADVNTSTDKGLTIGCEPELQFCLLQQVVIFPKYAIWCHVHTVLSLARVSAVLFQVSEPIVTATKLYNLQRRRDMLWMFHFTQQTITPYHLM